MKNKNILITGGAGAIGSNLINQLYQKNNIFVVDNLVSGTKTNIPISPNIIFIEGDILDNNLLENIFKNKIDIVFHLATFFANQNSVDHPQKDLDVNGRGTLLLLQLSHKYSVEKFIYTSSSCVYGNSALPVLEDSKIELETPYAITKYLGEHYTIFFNKHYNLNTCILRLFNSFGPGEYPGRYRNVIPNFFEKAINGQPLSITGTGRETRDFTFVTDTVEGIIKAAVSNMSNGEIFNIGTQKEITISYLAKQINRIVGNRAGIIVTKKRDWDGISRRCSDISKANSILNYDPQIKFEIGLSLTYDWIKEVL